MQKPQTVIHLQHVLLADGSAVPPRIDRAFMANPANYKAAVGGDWELVRVHPQLVQMLCMFVMIDPAELVSPNALDPDSRSIVMLVNELGAIRDPEPMPTNPVASVMYGGPFWFLRGAIIHGNALIVEID